MPVYSLMLSTSNGGTGYTNQFNPVSDVANNKNRVAWSINWDDVFKGDNSVYKNCSVRYHFQSDKIDMVGSNGVWNNYCGFLTLSTPSRYQAIRGAGGVILDVITPQYINDLSNNTFVCMAYNQSTLTAGKGVDINMPMGSQLLEVALLQDVIAPVASPISSTIGWNLFLTFELY